MRSTIALTAGALLGATAGIVCLFALSGHAHLRSTSTAATAAKKSAATAKVSPERVASKAAETHASKAKVAPVEANAADVKALAKLHAGNAASAGATVAAKAPKALPVMKVRGGAGASAQPAAGSVAKGAGAKDASGKVAANAELRKDNAVMRGISGFAVGVDLRHPIAGPGGKIAAVPAGLHAKSPASKSTESAQ